MEKRMATIYKWNCKDSYDVFYIGSTWDMNQRKTRHKSDCKRHPNQLCYKICNENGGFDNFVFEVLEEFECYSDEDRCIMEQHYIDREIPCMNGVKAHTTREEYVEKGKIRNREYYKENKERHNEICSIYYQEHREEIKKQKSEYYQKHKQEINKKKREKQPCPKCKKIMSKNSINPHLKTTCPNNK